MAPTTRSKTTKTPVSKASTAKSSKTVNKAAEAYAAKAKKAASTLEGELEGTSDGLQKAVWALKARADALEAELSAVKQEPGEAMPVDEDPEWEEDGPSEAEDEALFVSRTAVPIIVTDDPLKDPGFNRYHNVVGRGPPNAEKLELVPSYGVSGQKCLNDERRDPNQIRSERQNGRLRIAIQGVAWVSPEGHQDPIRLLDPNYLEATTKDDAHSDGKGAGRKERRKPLPHTVVKVKWLDGNNQKTFETRSTVRSVFGMKPVAAVRDYMIGDRVILAKGTVMPAADLAIFSAAIISWDRHEEWKRGDRKREERSPTPHDPLEVTKTKREAKKTAK
ncbi:hypothetical protein HER10_EVM0007305 [Colletotrichum scovillei]|uniref:uncharacterized protein n=1 Tax=Colletotrichum scovillei TaxID=1209932 RepID=UPI0015C3A3F5|nr:uncharacterized protein HER10_EVM0007305 [Colletotrichum scovillei]KAF4772731.1 hypothetical protein HER10_EVM0007305 [Colletotrichum scovillei]